MDMLSGEFAQLKERYESKTAEAKEMCEAEKAHLREEFDLEILKMETKREEERTSIESQNIQKSERMSSKLDQCESTIVYMGNVMVQVNEVMSGVHSVSSCSCLLWSAEPGNLIPAKIEYHCGELSNRTFSLPCSGGVCKSQALPSCTEPLEWDEEESVTVSHQCQETAFNNKTLLCGGTTKEVRMTSKVGGGVVEELLIVPCMDCSDLLTWTEWGPCPEVLAENLSVDEEMMPTLETRCRRRGSETFGFEEEKGGVVTSPNYPHRYPPNLYKSETIRAEQGLVLVLEFTAFETNCYSDHLTIEDGDGTTLVDRQCGRYGQTHCDFNGQIQCNPTLPPVVRSRSNMVHLHFRTNSNIEFSGWRLNWKAVTPRV